MKKKLPKKLKTFIKIIALILLAVFLIFPLPYRIEIPGGVKPLNESIEVSGHKAPVKADGGFYLPTVKTAPANVSLLIYNIFDRYADIHPANSREQALSKRQQDEIISQMQMRVSENIAIWEAFRLARKPIDFEYGGAYVTDLASSSSFRNVLRPLDLITHVDGQSFESSEEMYEYIKKQEVGAPVKLQYQREVNGEKVEQTAEGSYIKLDNGATGIGVTLVEKTRLLSEPHVSINVGEVSGPSGGLLFTLDIYSKLAGRDLTQGRKVTGSVSIALGGAVWPVGGIRQKVIAAERQEMDVFFVYDDGTTQNSNNYIQAKNTAEWLHSDMSIVPINTVRDAVEYLEGQGTVWLEGSDKKTL